MRCFMILLLCVLLAGIKSSAQTFSRKAGDAAPSAITELNSSKESLQKLSGIFDEGFEAYDDFSISIPPWTTLDLDGKPTWGIDNVTFPNQFAPMAFMVFNPSATTPPLINSAITPNQGFKFAACFSANGAVNNDWLISPALVAGTNTSVSFFVKSYTAQYGLERYRFGVSSTDNQPESFTILTGANYLTAPAGAWEQKTFDLNEYNGQTIYLAIQCVSNDAFIFMVDDFRFATLLPETSSITGLVTDATNGQPISGAQINIAGISTTTDEQGNYSITNIPAGNLAANFTANPTYGNLPLSVQFNDQSTENTHTVTCSKSGYLTYSNNQVEIPQGGSLNLNISLSPELEAGNLRFVLNWGSVPLDLDSHLLTPEIDGNSYHVYYEADGNATAAPYALLDYDITTGYGPETMTIYQRKPGIYQYYVHNYSESPAITTSRAVVQIYDAGGLIQTVQIPGFGLGNYWHVCDINGLNGELIIKNLIMATPPVPTLKNTSIKNITKPSNLNRYINSWFWDFGDGNTSTAQNPLHTFTEAGNYTISLTVNNGTAQHTEVKPAYILVGTQSIDLKEITNPIKIYPLPATNELKVVSTERILQIQITTLSGILLNEYRPESADIIVTTNHLSSGIYLIHIKTAKGSVVKKFSKI